MNRWWAVIPLAVAAAMPICATPRSRLLRSKPLPCCFACSGSLAHGPVPVTAGCIVATIGYAVALLSGSADLDLIGGGIFGLALLFLLDLSEFARRFRGAEIASDVLRAQLVYWLQRAATISGIVVVLILAGFMVSSLVPPGGRAIVSGLGALLAFAGVIYGASTRTR